MIKSEVIVTSYEARRMVGRAEIVTVCTKKGVPGHSFYRVRGGLSFDTCPDGIDFDYQPTFSSCGHLLTSD